MTMPRILPISLILTASLFAAGTLLLFSGPAPMTTAPRDVVQSAAETTQPGAGVSPGCYDYLAGTDIHKLLEFEGCEYIGGQLSSYESRYKLSGKHADQVERYLRDKAGHPPLKFVCCGWESQGGGQVPGGHEFPFVIKMTSGETAIDDRSRWHEIDSFTVSVELPGTLP